MSRRLNISPEVAQVIPASIIAHLESQADDDDNVCGVCLRFIDTDVANIYAAHDQQFYDIRTAHPECHDSVVIDEPGLRAAKHAQLEDGGVDMLVVMLVRRAPEPRSVLLQEPRWFVGRLEDDEPLEQWADAYGLVPVSGYLDRIDPPRTAKARFRLTGERLELVHENGVYEIPAFDPEPFATWREQATASRRVLLILGRGLHLNRPDPDTIGQALHTQPCWGAVLDVDVDDGRKPPSRSPGRRRNRRRRKGLGASSLPSGN